MRSPEALPSRRGFLSLFQTLRSKNIWRTRGGFGVKIRYGLTEAVVFSPRYAGRRMAMPEG